MTAPVIQTPERCPVCDSQDIEPLNAGGTWACDSCSHEWATVPPPVDWSEWLKCRVCKAKPGEPCRSLSGTVTDGQPDGVSTVLAVPHKSRKRRSGVVAS